MILGGWPVQWERGGDRYDVIFDAVGKRKSGAAMVNSGRSRRDRHSWH
jgi:hypothetical protein